MKNSIQNILIYFFILYSFFACVKKPNYPSEPVIEYKDFLRYGNPSDPDSTKLVISFTDNEGDIGLGQADTQGVLKYGNVWMDYYYWDTIAGGHWATDIPWTPAVDTLKIPYRVPPVGDKSQPTKGLIYVKQEKPVSFYKKFMYKVYMYDKALHKSNVIETPALNF